MASQTIGPEDEKRVKVLGFLRNKGTDDFSARVVTGNGVVSVAQMQCIVEAAERFGNGNVSLTTRLNIEVPGIPYGKIEDFRAYIAQHGLQTGGTGAKVRPVVSCKGTICQYGLIDTFALSREIHERFIKGYNDVTLPHKFKIAVGGCPNNCVKPDLNDVGIIGQMIPDLDTEHCKGCSKCAVEAVCPVSAAKVVAGKCRIDTQKCKHCGRCIGECHFDALQAGTRGYKVYIGGRWGKETAQGRALNTIFIEKEEVLDVVEKIIQLYRDNGKKGERFAQMIERCGFENIVEEILGREKTFCKLEQFDKA